jgi:hypothetical protein
VNAPHNAALADTLEKWKPVSHATNAERLRGGHAETTTIPTETTPPVRKPRPRASGPLPQSEFEGQAPRRGLKLSGFAILGLLCVLVAGDQIRIRRPEFKYRLQVEIETPDGVKSSANVYSVTPNRSYGGSNTGESAGPKTRGDALFVDLGGGRNVVALLAVGAAPTDLDATNYTAMRAFLAAGRKVQFRDMKKKTAMTPVAVPDENAPVLVSFKDAGDPKSARRLTADNAQDLLGAGYKLRAVMVSTTANGFWPMDFGGALGEPVSHGIEDKLPWLRGEAGPVNQAAAAALEAAGIKGVAAGDAKLAFERQ